MIETARSLFASGSTGTVIGLIGIGLAFVFYLRSRRNPRMAYQADHVTLVGATGAAFPEEVQVLFQATPVPRVTASRVVIWNCGNQTIDGREIVHTDPLRFEVEESGTILKHRILRQTRSVNGWKFEWKSHNRLELAFEYLDPGDGINLEITHTEPADGLAFAGTIKGIPSGIRNFGRVLEGARLASTFVEGLHPRVIYSSMFTVGAFFAVTGLLGPAIPEWMPSPFGREFGNRAAVRWVSVVLGGLYVFLAGLLWWQVRRRYPAGLELEE